MLQKSSELCIQDFYCIFVSTDLNLIVCLSPRNCVHTQYAALSGAMTERFWYEIKIPNFIKKKTGIIIL